MDTPMSPAVDPEVLEMLASLQEPGEPDLVVELVSLFLRDTPERLSGLQERPLDPVQTVRIAHAVKGSAGNLGASLLQDLAGRLEQAGRRGQADAQLDELADAVRTEYARVERHLQGVLAERAGSDSARRSL
jgi:HPt (histidine-containing phosphotransfer) domain-containing protein